MEMKKKLLWAIVFAAMIGMMTTGCDDSESIEAVEEEEPSIAVESAYIQYRSYPDAADNHSRGWISIYEDGKTVDESDISKISLMGPDGAEMDIDSSFYKAEYFWIVWDESNNMLGPMNEIEDCAFSIRLTDEIDLPQGQYQYEVRTSEGDTVGTTVNYPGSMDIDRVDVETMEYRWNEDGSLWLSWEFSGFADQFRLTFWNWGAGDVLTIKLPSSVTEVTIPAQDVVKITQEKHPHNVWWGVQTRNYSEGMNYARGYSGSVQIPWHFGDTIYIDGAYLQYRTFFNAENNRYQGWIGLFKGNGLIDESDVVDIRLVGPDGNLIDVNRSFYLDSYMWAEWDEAVDELGDEWWLEDSGFSIRLVDENMELPAGEYTYEVLTTQGDLLTYSIDFPGKSMMETVDPASMSYQWNADGSLYLSWAFSGVADQLRITFWSPNAGDLFNLRLPTSVTEVTLPFDWIDWINQAKNPTQVIWNVQTRNYNDDWLNYARGYSGGVEIDWGTFEDMIFIDGAYLQYRTYFNSEDNRYQGFVGPSKGEGLIAESDIVDVRLFGPNGEMIDITRLFGADRQLNGRWDEEMDELQYTGWSSYAYFSIYMVDENMELPAGEYTYEVTTAQGDLLTYSIDFPGKTIMETIDPATMSYQWNADGSIHLSWAFSGMADQFQITFWSPDAGDLLSLRLPASIKEVTLPAQWIEEINQEKNPVQVRWRVQTQNDNVSYARGYSGSVEIDW